MAPETIAKDRSGLWLEFSHRAFPQNTIVGDDPHDRVYYLSAQGQLRVADGARRTQGPPHPGSSLPAGVPPFEAAPTALVLNVGEEYEGATWNEETEEYEGGVRNSAQTRAYAVTLVNGFGEEGPPSPPSGFVEVFPGGSVEITRPAYPSGASNYDWRIYRAVEGVFQYVGQSSGQSFTDSLPGDLGQELLPSMDWAPPPSDGLIALTTVSGGFYAAAKGNQVLFSEFALPHAWPFMYRQPLDHTIKALATYGNTLVALTDGPVYVAQGSTPSAMAMAETGLQYACASERSVVSFVNSVVFASPDGLVQVSDQGSGLVTLGTFTDREWRKLRPETMVATQWMGYIYLVAYDGEDGPGGFLFIPQRPDLGVVFLDLPRTRTMYTHVETDSVYMVDRFGGQILEWDADPNFVFAAFRWRSSPMDPPDPIPINAGQVKADGYPVTFRVFADGELQAEHEVQSYRPFRIPGARLARTYHVEVEGEHRVHEVFAATTIPEVVSG
jgi:hypothetical protein